MKITKHDPEPVVVPPATYTLEVTQDELDVLRTLIYNNLGGSGTLRHDLEGISDYGKLSDKVEVHYGGKQVWVL